MKLNSITQRLKLFLSFCSVLVLFSCAGTARNSVKHGDRKPNEAYQLSEKNKPLVIAHRGASGLMPEHTLEGYTLAIEQGADFIEPDLVLTKDRYFIVRHENELSDTTDVAKKFPQRKVTKVIDGVSTTGWFAEDFTLEEIKTLRAVQRLPFRSHEYDGKFQIPTYEEVLTLQHEQSEKHQRKIGIYPELKHPTYMESIGFRPVEDFAAMTKRILGESPKYPIFVQCFEIEPLERLSKLVKYPLIQLIGDYNEIPYDQVVKNTGLTFAKVMTPDGLRKLAVYLAGIGPNKAWLARVTPDGKFQSTGAVALAHSLGLLVHPWTFRNENQFLLPIHQNHPELEYQDYFSLGIDGLFSDFTANAVAARKVFLEGPK